MRADIMFEREGYPARITVMESRLGLPSLWVHDGCFDVGIRLTPAMARSLAEQLLAFESRDRGDTGGTGDGGRLQVSSEPEAPAQSGANQPAATSVDADDATAAIDAVDRRELSAWGAGSGRASPHRQGST